MPTKKAGGQQMANQEQLAILKQGVEAWNQWRHEHPETCPDLSEAIIVGAQRPQDDSLWRADLWEANLSSANLNEADLRGANLSQANLSNANLSGADLSRAMLVETDFTGATLTNCNIYGIAAWNVQLKSTIQINLVITPDDEPTIT